MWLTRQPDAEVFYKWGVETAVQSFIKDSPTHRGLDAFSVSHTIFSIEPHAKSRQVPIARVATKHIDELILLATVEADAAERITFYRSLSAHKWFKAPEGYLLERFVLAWLTAYPASTPICCSTAMYGAPTLAIPVCPLDQSISLTDLNELKGVKKCPLPFCFIPTSSTFPTIDAIVIDDKFIITVQVTVSRTHSAKPEGFEQIFTHLPAQFRNKRQWCHVFVTGDEENAQALRYKPRDLPKKMRITVYSAVFDIGWLSRIHNRFKLSKEKVSWCWLRAIVTYKRNEQERDTGELSTHKEDSEGGNSQEREHEHGGRSDRSGGNGESSRTREDISENANENGSESGGGRRRRRRRRREKEKQR